MAKAKAKLFDAIQNPLYGHTKMHNSVSGNSLAFYTGESGIIMRTKPKTPHHTSPAQAYQNELWKDADCMYRARTHGQTALWNNYYVREYRAGRTRTTQALSEIERAMKIPFKDMSKQALFFSHALRLDLYVFLTEFLQSEWIITSVIDTGESWEIELGLTNPKELTEAVIFQERLPVRGR